MALSDDAAAGLVLTERVSGKVELHYMRSEDFNGLQAMRDALRFEGKVGLKVTWEREEATWAPDSGYGNGKVYKRWEVTQRAQLDKPCDTVVKLTEHANPRVVSPFDKTEWEGGEMPLIEDIHDQKRGEAAMTLMQLKVAVGCGGAAFLFMRGQCGLYTVPVIRVVPPPTPPGGASATKSGSESETGKRKLGGAEGSKKRAKT